MKTYVTLLSLESRKLHGCHVSKLKHAERPVIMAMFVIHKDSTAGLYVI